MKNIKIFPCPHVEVRLHLTDEMIEQYKACGKSKGDCDCCLWNDMKLEGVGICTFDCVEKWMRQLIEEGEVDG